MNKNKYRISQQAIDDLENIWVYTLNKWSKEQADRYYDLIIGEIEFIADNFMSGKSAEQTRKNYRVTKIKSHLIFYRKIEDDIVEIVRILHQRMDIKKTIKIKIHTRMASISLLAIAYTENSPRAHFQPV